MEFELIALKYAESTFPEWLIFEGGRKDVRIPISFIVYLIKTEQSLILVDAGCENMGGFDMKYFTSPENILKMLDISPEDINHVIITHPHHDHIQAVYLFKNATIHIEKEAFEEGKKYISDDFSVNIFEDEYVIDDYVRIKKIGGHCTGSCIVIANEYVIAGDECYSLKSIEKKIPTGAARYPKKNAQFIDEYSKPCYKVLSCHDSCILPGQNGYVKII